MRSLNGDFPSFSFSSLSLLISFLVNSMDPFPFPCLFLLLYSIPLPVVFLLWGKLHDLEDGNFHLLPSFTSSLFFCPLSSLSFPFLSSFSGIYVAGKTTGPPNGNYPFCLLSVTLLFPPLPSASLSNSLQSYLLLLLSSFPFISSLFLLLLLFPATQWQG
jgi:hypothetical protein